MHIPEKTEHTADTGISPTLPTGEKKMEKNRSIECTVNECLHHCKGEDYCSLDRIRVVPREPSPAEERCTDCASYYPDETAKIR